MVEWSSEPWIIFWYGLNGMKQVSDCIDKARAKPTSIDRTQPFDGIKESDGVSHSIAASALSADEELGTTTPLSSHPSLLSIPSSPFSSNNHRGYHTSRRSFSTSSSPRKAVNTSPSKVGLIGARGHTGGELISLIASHPHLSISVASSRALKGQSLSQVFPHLPSSVPWASTLFSDSSLTIFRFRMLMFGCWRCPMIWQHRT